ncbi:MAG: acyl-CoA synthetase (AMP-forming)/AMP-acid ligase [Gammaproteobacteria bacterium]|nr:acyl-CoA synthetase (AMP-forming)/AMP-acid ligase [Gammaproteobacteria bacterium]
MWVYPEIRTLGDFPEYYARSDPGRTALKGGGRTVSFADFERVCRQVAHFLMAKEMAAGELVGFLGKNSFDFYFALFGCSKTPAALVVLNWRLSPSELAAQVQDSETRLVIVGREIESLWTEACQSLGASAPRTLWIDAQDTLEKLVADQPVTRPEVWVSEDDTAFQLYTSGTTGRPKGVMHTHGGINRMRLCEHFEPSYQWHAGDSFINALPNFHLLHVGIAVQCLYNGVSITVVRQFEPVSMLATITAERPTLLTLTPTMLQILLDHPNAATTDFSSLRLTLYAGSPISLGLIKRAIVVMPCQFMQFYGSTESGGAASILRPQEHDLNDEARLQSCGRPLPLIEFRIVDAAGNIVADGVPGELLIRAPSITKGYWRQPEATAAVLQNGWYRTGDIARCDADGLYYIVDRAKDMIVSGGENIYSAEVESALSMHPGVAAVAVIGVPDEHWGEAVKALVILREGQQLDEDTLIRFCRGRLAAYKGPKSIEFVEGFPLVASGKVSKKELRERYWIGTSRGVA